MKITVEVTAGPAKGKLFAFEQPDLFIVGRAKDSRISLPNDPYLSRQHFVMELAPPNCKITDLDSKNGTFVNNVRYGGRKHDPKIKQAPSGVKTVTIQNGEVVVGDTRLKIGTGLPDKPAVKIQPAKIESSSGTRRVETAAESGAQEQTVLATPPDGAAQAQGGEQTEIENPAHPLLIGLLPGDTLCCSRCRKDVTKEVGNRGRIAGAEYMCHDCRANHAFALKSRANRSRHAFEFKPEQDALHVRPLPASSRKDAPSLEQIHFPGYKVIDVLGSGGMGVVYQCSRDADGLIVAIKALLPNVPVTFENYRIFHREIELTRKLRHPNIVEVLDHGHVKGSYYCVLEYIDGLSLKDYVHQMGGKLTLKQAAPLMLDSLAGLAAAHQAQIETRAAGPKMLSGIVHRDLKPENILLKREAFGWSPKIADFGIAKNFESAGMTDMTLAGVCGTPTYWPREQLTHYRYLHPATDVFSIASVFFEILTGKCARPGMQDTLMQSQRKNVSPQLADFMRVICANPIPPIRDMEPAIPPLVAAVIDRALLEVEVPIDETEMRETLQRLRYPDAGAFRDAFADALRAEGLSV